MTTFELWLSLGLCTGTYFTDVDLLLCKYQYEAKFRQVQIEEPMDEFDEVYFAWAMTKAVGRNTPAH